MKIGLEVYKFIGYYERIKEMSEEKESLKEKLAKQDVKPKIIDEVGTGEKTVEKVINVKKPYPDTRTVLQKVDMVLDTVVKMLDEMLANQNKAINTDKDRVSYKEGLVDGLCMMSWVGKDGNDHIGEKNDEGTGKLLSDVLEEIGITFGFDGKEEFARVKSEDENTDPTLTEVTDEDVAEISNNESDCPACNDHKPYEMMPSHNGSESCESGSLASGGNISHCSCDICF